MENKEKRKRQEIFAKVVKAGRRTYFFDVHQTKKGDLYLIITESKKFYNKKGSFHYKKHKIFLYREDFDEFADAFKGCIDFINENIEESLEKGGLNTVKQEDEKEPGDVSSDYGNDNTEDQSPEIHGHKDNTQNLPENMETEKNPDKAFTDVSFDDLDDTEHDKGEDEKENDI